MSEPINTDALSKLREITNYIAHSDYPCPRCELEALLPALEQDHARGLLKARLEEVERWKPSKVCTPKRFAQWGVHVAELRAALNPTEQNREA